MPISAISVSRCGLKIPSESFLSKKFTCINVSLGQIGKSLELLSGYDFAGLISLLAVLLIQISLEIASNHKVGYLRQ